MSDRAADYTDDNVYKLDMSLSNGASVNYHILGESPTNLFKSNKVFKVMATPSGPQGRRLWSLVPGPGPAHRFIAPSLPFPGKGDQAVDAHAARAPAPGEGLVYRTMCFEGR